MAKHVPARGRRWQATLIITLFFMAVAGAAAIGWWYAREAPPHQGPIVLIAADDLDPARLDAGHAPAIAALAADSVIFDRAYAHSPLLLPAEATILSGELPYEHGVRDDAGFTLKPEVRTLAELLRGRGFDTGAAVSSFFLRRDAGVAQGFSFFDAQFQPPGDDAPVAGRPGSLTIDAAEQWARAHSSQRYFLFVQVGGSDADAAVRRIADLLKERRLYDKATIILVGARGRSATRLDASTLRVPLLIKQPSREGAGEHVTAPVQQVDLLPTILDFVRAPLPGGLHGRSLRAAIDGTTLPAQPVYAESLAAYYRFGGEPLFALWSDPEPSASASGSTGNAAALRDRLQKLVAQHPPQPPARIAPADEEALALAGYLQGLPTHDDVSADASSSDADAAVLDQHRAAAIEAGHRRYSEAIRLLQGIAHGHPMLVSVQYQLGRLLARSGRYDEAATVLKTAMDLWPDRPEIPVALASALVRGGHLDDAQRQADAAVAAAPDDDAPAAAIAHEAAARVALARADADAAAQHADAAHAADPSLPLPQFVRGRVLYDKGDYDGALAAFREAETALRDGGRIEQLHLYIGETLARMEQYAEAEEELHEELREFPRDLQAYSALAMLYHASEREDEIEDVLNQLVDTAPTPEGYGMAARLWSTLGERSRAEALRSDARTRFRGDPSLVLLGRDGRR